MNLTKWGLSTIILAALAATGCGGSDNEEANSDEIVEDTLRPPQVVRVPVRFTHNEVKDVGVAFTQSWVPFVSVGHQEMDGASWANYSPAIARDLVDWYQPDRPGAGYATANFL